MCGIPVVRSQHGHGAYDGPGPSFASEHRPFEWGWRAVGLCSRCLGGGGGCAGGSVPLGAVTALSWCEEVSLGGILVITVLGMVAHEQARHPSSHTTSSRSPRRRWWMIPRPSSTGLSPARRRRASARLRRPEPSTQLAVRVVPKGALRTHSA